MEFTDPDGAPVEREECEVDWDEDAAEKGGYETFMLKEIHEQPQSLATRSPVVCATTGIVELAEFGLDDEFWRACAGCSSSPAAPRFMPA